ncbi:MAG: nickel-dependent hydrogenase large subunit [Gemmatimonadetes bacterium]|nr:nickel-dependent hydrogenase large subunit [Gemmatimonadota bacterium]
MCFHQLPIRFDAEGNPTLDEAGWDAARSPAVRPDPESDRPGLTEFLAAPVTRVAGALEFRARVDLEERRVHDARTSAAAFRGYEIVLRGRDPREAMDISSRVCGVCGGVHSTTSSMALDMAFPVVPPPLGVLARNIAQAGELLYDHVLHMCLLAGPDYSEQTVRRAEPAMWKRAESSPAPHASVHGRSTVAEIMQALNPLSGELYREALDRTRIAMKIVETMVGNYPHPTTMVPGGINVLFTEESFRTVERLADEMLDFVKELILVFDDLVEFYLDARPEYARCGERPKNLLCFGRYDDVDLYDGSYARLDAWSAGRTIPPGVIIDGELRTRSLRAINLGIEEFVEHSFYERWSGDGVPLDPAGGPLSPFHPWNKTTVPRPEARDWKSRYTWSTAPRWDREVVEAGPIARNWMLALGGVEDRWGGRLEGTGASIRFTLPASESHGELPFEWRIPDRLNALERNRARAYHLGVTWLQLQLDVRRSIERYRKGERRVWAPHPVPEQGIGAGFWEAARGALGHWVTLDDGVVDNYQIVTPSAFNASPRDPWGNPGPYEEAALNTPILEEISGDGDGFMGLDLMRAVRSFDPCMPCAVHMDTGMEVVVREVVSCGCSLG